ncbi:IgGFc-binding protein-like [Conger conger]|uniref:IgGFc-binding protein-like n=1 Tax=Conger conger TaxID=82655 RepID=UPI002A59AEAD|nr:IgGFc-binding protein-like [Conger conger]
MAAYEEPELAIQTTCNSVILTFLSTLSFPQPTVLWRTKTGSDITNRSNTTMVLKEGGKHYEVVNEMVLKQSDPHDWTVTFEMRLELLNQSFSHSVSLRPLPPADGCPVGRDFLTAFMANFKTSNYYAGLQLAITAHKTNANVRLEVKGIRYTKNVLVKKRSTVRVPIPSKAEIWNPGSSGKTLQISSDADISVVAFNYKPSTGDSSIVFPTTELDTKYMIYTPETVSNKHDKLVAIINGDHKNTVNLLPYRDMKVKGMARWKKGVKVTIKMAPYEVYQLRSRVSLTGTEIKASRPVAVLAGHQCAKAGIFCSHLFQQLLPVQKLTTHWLLNGLYTSLPLELEDGKLSIIRIGYFGVVSTDFGLKLKFDWHSKVKLTLPGPYSGKLGGLCGNWNGDATDDMVMPDNRPAKSVAIFGESWKSRDDPRCSSDCGGKCPKCDPKSMPRYQKSELCGKITNPNGPFKLCHGKVSPNSYFDDCVFDMCLNDGHASTLCSALTAYTEACQEAHAQVGVWRSANFCPTGCDENSHYEVCAKACPFSCLDLSQPETCDEAAACAEGCVCDEGFALSDGGCVPQTDCGCLHDDRYYKTGQVFFPEGLCAARCVCEGGGVVRCDRNFSCGPDEKCQVKDGVRACFPDGAGTCSVFGASTYHSFDSRSFNTFGNCVLILAQVTTAVQRIPFTVSVKQESIPGELPVTRSVEIKVNGLKIALFPGTIWEAEVDGEKCNLPWSQDDKKVKVFQNGLYIVVDTDFGLKVKYDSVSGVITEVPSTYKGVMHGLCGNYNGDPDDDFSMPSGLPASTLDFFVEAWVVLPEDAQCQVRCGSKCPNPDEGKKPDAEEACYILMKNNGPFAQCHLAVPPQKYFEECVQEMIQWQVNTTLCPHIQRYAALCQAIGVTIKEWRTKTFCYIQCPEKSHYELCADTCASTCASLSVSSQCPHCHEGCQCDEGFVSDGSMCVPLGSCGCVVNGRYFKCGESEMQEECTQKCSCKNGEFSCKDTSCTDTEMCLIKKGVMGCYKDPCEEKDCRVKEGCMLVGNEAVCVPDSRAFCWAMGDPHYQGFDGGYFSFQGTCSYTLVKTTGKDQTLPAFTIETRNGMRGNPEGSFLRSIFIKLKGHTIFIPFMDRGKLLINDTIRNMPVFLENGTIKITQTGIKGTLMTDFGLEIVFDWISMFMVTVSSSYYDNLAGLCGTYNENQMDDFKTPGGSIVVNNTTEWARSWAVDDGNPFCWHSCLGACPTCSQEAHKMYETEKYCGSIIQKDGPFNPCHGVVEPDEYASNCIYDVCSNDGRQDVLCAALTTYVAACLETEIQNIVDPKWREITNCTWPCPENSHYELCSSPCPATCAEPDGRDNCSLPCTEGCHCDADLVLSGDKCVHFETECGCMQGDRYYKPDETFWDDDECQSKCTCDGKTQTVRCEKRGCTKNEHCGVVGGVRDCYPTHFKTCLARGDPHFVTFDGVRFDFQGNCIYQLATVCSKVNELEQFNITLENNNRGSRRVSFAKVVTVSTAHAVFTMSRNFPGRVLVDGVLTSLPFYLNDTVARIYRRGRLAVLETHFGLTVTYDWKSSVRVTVPSTYHGAICGLCGNYNGDPTDDLRLPGGAQAKNPTEFGDSHLVGETPGCSPVCKDCASPLLKPGTPLPDYVSQCDVITDRTGPLRDCRDKVETFQYHENCVFDVHLNQGLQKAACDLIEAYIEDCQEKGGKIEEWRSKDFCAFSCPVNSAYNLTAPGCPPTCYSMAAPPGCKASCREGCQCNPGFMLSDKQCVSLHDCGCSHEGRYYKSGAEFYSDRTCRKHCTCSSGVLDCRPSACGPQETCSVVDAVLGCFPKSDATCVLSGNSYFHTFDRRGFNFWGPCGYTLVQGSEAAGQQRFHVGAQMEPSKKSVLLESVMVDVFGHSLVLERDSPWQIEVDGVHTNLPVSLNDGKLKVTQEGRGMVLQASFGLRLTYDFQTMVSITVPSTYYGQVSGLCGNYNGNADDDLKLSSGVQTDDVSVFGAAWRLEGDDLTCGSACPKDGCAKPDNQVRSKLGKRKKCGLISDANGPLAACHSTLPPAGFLQTCIYNSFLAGANAESVCSGIEAYVSACQAAGVTLKAWRTESFCPADECPVNSNYTLCTHTCSSNCNSLTSPEICPNVCLEGCKCDDGFVADGNLCVPVQKCGCSINGTYLKSGETAYMSKCSQRCRCSAHNNPVCEATACPAETSCDIANGFLECLPANSTCTLNNGNSITSFDGNKFEFKEKGHYALFHPSSTKLRTRFKVGAKIQLLNGRLTLAGVQVVFEGTEVIVSPQNTVWVQNEPVSLPWVSKKKRLEVNKTDRDINILYHGKVAVTLRIQGDMSVTVSRSLLSHVRGLCASHRPGPQKIKWSHMAFTKNMKNLLGKLFAWKLFGD